MKTMRVIPITINEANRFVNQYHRHNTKTSRNGGRFAIGAYEDTLGLVGIAIVGNPIARNLCDGFTTEILRTCTRPDAPKNTNSFLYSACKRVWQSMGGRKIITYTLLSESGASLRGAGWEHDADVKGGTWNRLNRRRVTREISLKPKIRWTTIIKQDQSAGDKEGNIK